MKPSLAPFAAAFVAVLCLFASGRSAAAQTPGQILLVTSFNNDRVVRFDPVTGAFEGDFIAPGSGGALDAPYGITYGPDGRVYVAGHLSDNVLRYDAQTGALLGAFVASGANGLDGPTDITFGPDGNFYIADFNNDRILRYNGTTGAFIGVFVAAASGGLDGPNGFTFGPDGNLYVASHNTDQVLRYNGTTGAFIDAFVAAAAGGLDGPLGMVFRSGTLYVASYSSHKVNTYDGTTGAYLATPFAFNSPTGLLDSNSILHMASFSEHNVRRHHSTAGFLSTLSGGMNGPTFMALIPAPSCTKEPDGMVSWWPGNQNGRDLRENNYAALKNGTTVAPAKVAKGFSLDGVNDFVEAPDSPSLSITGAISIDAWVRPDTTAGNQVILSKYDSPANQQSYALGVDGGQVHFTVYQTGDASVYRGAQTTTSIPAGQFTHVAATFNPTTQAIKIYLNGVEAVTAPLAGSANVTSIFDSTAPLRIGAVKNSVAGLLAFDGLLDEVELFARDLTAEEVLALWNAGGKGKCRECTEPPTGMLGWWPADGNAHDIAGGHDGTLNNTTFVKGMVEQAFDFTGLPAVTVPDAPELNPQTFSVDAWVTTANLSCSGCAAFVVAKSGLDGIHGFELAVRETGLLNFSLNDSLNGQFLPSTVSIADGSFHHVAATYDGSTMKLYIDGVLNNQTSVSSVINYEAGRPLVIGGREFGLGGSTATYPGLIDELELFGRALTAEEIRSIYNAGPRGKCRDCAEPPTGMQSWWPAEGHTFDIQGANHAALVGGATYATGKVGVAFSLDGVNDTVTAPQPAPLNSSFALDAWIKPDTLNGINPVVFERGPSVSNRIGIQILSNGGLCGYIDSGACTVTAPAGTIAAGTFSHVAFVFDDTADQSRLYVNGVEVGAAAETRTPAGAAGTLTLGDSPVSAQAGEFFDGLIDEVEVFGRALTAAEVRSIADAGVAGKCRVDLSVTKLDAPDPVLAGEEITYTISAKNLSDTTATNVVVTDQLPNGVTYVSDTGGCSHSMPSNTLTCAVSGLDPGQTFTFNVTVKTVSTTNAVNTVTVDGDQPDPFPSNNKRTAVTKVVNLVSFKLSSDTTTGGCNTARVVTGTVTLSSPAPTGGATVLLTTSNATAAPVPANVVVPAGQTSATFQITPGAVTSSAFVTLSAKLDSPQNPAVVFIQTLTVYPIRVKSLTLDPTEVTAFDNSTATVVLTCAPAAETHVTLASNRPAVASVDSPLTFDPGVDTNVSQISTNFVSEQKKVAITASLNDSTRRATLTVNQQFN